MTYKLLILMSMVAIMAFGEDKVASASKCAGRGPKLRNLVTVCNNVESTSHPLEIVETSDSLWQICDPENGTMFEYLLTDPFNIPEPIVCAILKLDNNCRCEASTF